VEGIHLYWRCREFPFTTFKALSGNQDPAGAQVKKHKGSDCNDPGTCSSWSAGAQRGGGGGCGGAAALIQPSFPMEVDRGEGGGSLSWGGGRDGELPLSRAHGEARGVASVGGGDVQVC